MASFAKHLDDLVAQNLNKKAKGTVILTVANRDDMAPKLEAMAKDQKLAHVPLTIAVDGEKGPAAYQLSKDATYTIVVYDNHKKVTATFAFDALDTKSQETALAAFAKVLGVDAPRLDDKAGNSSQPKKDYR